MYTHSASPLYDGVALDEDESHLRTSDLPLSPGANAVLLASWLAICAIGLGIAVWGGSPLLGAGIVAVPTFVGMVIKPSFALCMMMMVLPTGTTAYESGFGTTAYHFSLDRGVGIAAAVSFALNIFLISHAKLKLNKIIYVALGLYSAWVCIAPFWSPYPMYEIRITRTQVQFFIMMTLIFLILQTNTKGTYTWALRSYVIGCLGMIVVTVVTGGVEAMAKTHKEGRAAVTIGGELDANFFAAKVGLGFLSAAYLLARDNRIFWRISYLSALLVLPIMMLRTGSRGSMVALAVALLSPLLFLRQALRRPSVVLPSLLVLAVGVGAGAYLLRSGGLERGVEERITNPTRILEAAQRRLELAQIAIRAALRWPLGTTYWGWQTRVGIEHWPHADFFNVLGLYGFFGAGLFAAVIILIVNAVRRIPMGLEKLYARSVVIFLLVMGLDVHQVQKKYFWLFLVIAISSERIARMFSSEREYPYASDYSQYRYDYPVSHRFQDASHTEHGS